MSVAQFRGDGQLSAVDGRGLLQRPNNELRRINVFIDESLRVSPVYAREQKTFERSSMRTAIDDSAVVT
jgi:hypothetical protein